MIDDLERLYQLQGLDTDIRDADAALAALDDGTGLAEELAAAEATLEELQATLVRDQARQRDRELELGSTEAKHQREWDRAYGGQVSNPKELESLEQEIEALGRAKGRLEEEVLVLMDKVDEEGDAVREQEALAADLRARLEQTGATYAAETERLKDELERLHAARAELAPQIGERTLKQYEALRASRGNLAVIEVVDGVCQGCNIAVPTAKVKLLRQTGGEAFCDNCQRFLYLDSTE